MWDRWDVLVWDRRKRTAYPEPPTTVGQATRKDWKVVKALNRRAPNSFVLAKLDGRIAGNLLANGERLRGSVEGTVLSDAVAFVLSAVAKGALESVELAEMAAKVGFSEATLKRARAKLRSAGLIEVTKEGIGRGCWTLSLKGAPSCPAISDIPPTHRGRVFRDAGLRHGPAAARPLAFFVCWRDGMAEHQGLIDTFTRDGRAEGTVFDWVFGERSDRIVMTQGFLDRCTFYDCDLAMRSDIRQHEARAWIRS